MSKILSKLIISKINEKLLKENLVFIFFISIPHTMGISFDTISLQISLERKVLENLLKDREVPGEFDIKYDEKWCRKGSDLPPDSF